MQSLLLRIFLSFWLIIALTIGLAALGGYHYSERLRDTVERFEINETVLAASRALQTGGRPGLEAWLRRQPDQSPVTILVMDESGADILGRHVPFPVRRAMRRYAELHGMPDRRHREPPNLRPARPLTQLVGPDEEVYTLFVAPPGAAHGRWYLASARFALLLLAVLVSGAVSYALARAIAGPVRRFREATVAIADGKLDTRVAGSIGRRRDEIGLLAHDIDAMANRLQEAARQQTELTRNISHELRSPLARLRVALELGRRRAGDLPEFARIENEAERLDELIGQILDYSRLEARPAEQSRAFALDDLVRDVVGNASFECRGRDTDGVTIDLVVTAAPRASGRESAVRSAVENVLRNAIRHSPGGGVVRVRLSEAAGRARIDVEDAGGGVPEDELDRMFEPFYRTRSTAADREYEGTGLGLAIAKRAVEKHGGSIRAVNSPGGGLAVRIEVPALPEAAGEPPSRG